MKEVARSCYTCRHQGVCGIYSEVHGALFKWMRFLNAKWQVVIDALGQICEKYEQDIDP
jgi:hypothetical protein